MKKLKDLKNFHFGMGLLILLIQIVFSISTALYVFGTISILFYFYETRIIKNLTLRRGETKSVKAILNSYKRFYYMALLPGLLLSGKVIMDLVPQMNITELILSNLIFSINMLVISGLVCHLSLKFEFRSLERELVENNK